MVVSLLPPPPAALGGVCVRRAAFPKVTPRVQGAWAGAGWEEAGPRGTQSILCLPEPLPRLSWRPLARGHLPRAHLLCARACPPTLVPSAARCTPWPMPSSLLLLWPLEDGGGGGPLVGGRLLGDVTLTWLAARRALRPPPPPLGGSAPGPLGPAARPHQRPCRLCFLLPARAAPPHPSAVHGGGRARFPRPLQRRQPGCDVILVIIILLVGQSLIF